MLIHLSMVMVMSKARQLFADLKKSIKVYPWTLAKLVKTSGGGTVEDYLKGDKIIPKANDASTVNGHTVEADVPANAKFTDTTYDFEVVEILIHEDIYNFLDFKVIPVLKLAILNYTRKIDVGNNTRVMYIPKEYAPQKEVYAYDYFQQSAGYGLIKLIVNNDGDIALSAVNYNDRVAGSFAMCWTYK